MRWCITFKFLRYICEIPGFQLAFYRWMHPLFFISPNFKTTLFPFSESIIGNNFKNKKITREINGYRKFSPTYNSFSRKLIIRIKHTWLAKRSTRMGRQNNTWKTQVFPVKQPNRNWYTTLQWNNLVLYQIGRNIFHIFRASPAIWTILYLVRKPFLRHN